MHENASYAYYAHQYSQGVSRMNSIETAKADAERLLAASLGQAQQLRNNPQGPRREFHMIWLVRASLGRRFLAEILDILVVTALASSLCGDLTNIIEAETLDNMKDLPPLPAAFAAIPELALLWQIYTPQVLVFFVTYYVVMASYQAISTWVGGGSSLGKWVVGIQVVHLGSGRPPSLASCMLRSLAKTATWLICCVLFVVAFADLPRRFIHDQLADTIVVKKRERQALHYLAQARVPMHGGHVFG